jgi:L-alanine-DL-glutamate epimerase-like enolase superfamily enzyme
MNAIASAAAPIESIHAAAYRIPTDEPEADGTFAWDSTVIVIVEVKAGGAQGVGYTYADASVATLIAHTLAQAVVNCDCFNVPSLWLVLQKRVRNLGRSGLAACAISALDCAFWDLKSRLLKLPLAKLLGQLRDTIVIYGSGGFTTYSDEQLSEQLSGWVDRDGCAFVKMKIGSVPADDPRRVKVAKSAIGDAQLFVDANGAFSVKQALDFAAVCKSADIKWFEEPVTSDDVPGLHLLRERLSPGTSVAAGEYNYTLDDARRLLEGEAVDVLQADVTRCGGITGFQRIAALCEAFHIDLSGHCAPALHRHVACAAPRLRHLEWFHDHVRIENMFFDGAPQPRDGVIRPDLTRAGHGLEFRRQDAERFKISECVYP